MTSQLATGALLSAFLTCAVPVYAQGFSVYENSACATGRAGAGVAEPCTDGSAIFYNPAGLADLRGNAVSVSAAPIAPRGQFVDGTSGDISALRRRTFVLPAGYGAWRLGGRTVVGVGLFVPYGLTSDWPATSEGRYIGYLSSLRSLYVQPTIAMRLTDRVMVGVGLDMTHLGVELRRRLDLSSIPVPGGPQGLTFRNLGVPQGTDFGDVDSNGSGIHLGAHVGMLVNMSERISFGARYLSRQRVSIDGKVTSSQIATGTAFDQVFRPQFADGQALGAQTATTSLPLPDQAVAGVSLRPTPSLRVLADYQFTAWHVLDSVVIQNQFAPPTVLVENFRDAHGVLVGAEESVGRLVLRVGTAWRTPAAPDQSVTPLLPDAYRVLVSGGAGFALSRRVRAELAYAHVALRDRAGRTTDAGLQPPSVLMNNGVYQYSANLIDVGLVVSYGSDDGSPRSGRK